MSNEEKENGPFKVESFQDLEAVLGAFKARIEAIEDFLRNRKAQFGSYDPTAALKWQAITAEEAEARKQAEEAKNRERARKQALVDKALKNPPTCEICGTIMTPLEPYPTFAAGNWTLRSDSPTSWYIRFKCPKVSGLGAHPGFVLYPDLPDQEIPTEKRGKSVTDGYFPTPV